MVNFMIFKKYFQSFQSQEQLWKPWIMEAIFWAVIIVAFVIFNSWAMSSYQTLSAGRTADEIQKSLLTPSPQTLAFVQQLQSYLIWLVAGLVALIALALLSFSLTQAVLWNFLLKQKFTFKKYWRWNWLAITLFFFLLLFLIPAFVIKVICAFIFKWILTMSDTLYLRYPDLLQVIMDVLNQIVTLVLTIIFFLFLFLVCYYFVQKYRVWASVWDAFAAIRAKWSGLWKIFLLMLGTGIVLMVVLSPLTKFIQNNPTWSLPLTLAVFLLYSAWMRVYLMETIS